MVKERKLKQGARLKFAAAIFMLWAVFAVAPPAHAGFWDEIKSLPDRFIEGADIVKNEMLPEFSGAARNAAVGIGGGIVQGLKFPAAVGENFGNAAASGAAGVASLGKFSADNLAAGLKTIGGAANAGIDAGAGVAADLSFAAQNAAPASIANAWQKITCFFGFGCPANDNLSIINDTNNQLSVINDKSDTNDKLSIINDSANNDQLSLINDTSPTQAVIQNIYPEREIQTKEVQTVHTKEIQTQYQTNTVIVDQEIKDKVNLLLRQMDSDRPGYSLGQTFTLPKNLSGDSLNLANGKFTIDRDGNLISQSLLSLSSSSDNPLIKAIQSGTGHALQADNITAKTNTLSTNIGNLILNAQSGLIEIAAKGIKLANNTPDDTDMALYNDRGTLKWNGAVLALGSSVSGTIGYLPKFTASNALGNSALFETGGNIGIGTITPTAKLEVAGGIIANTINGLTPTSQSTGWTIAGGTISKTLTLNDDLNASTVNTHIANTENPHGVTKTQVGLGNVENTALSTWAGTANITTLGAIGAGAWNAGIIAPQYGGTGIANNSANTLAFTGNYSLGLTLSADTALTLPTAGTLTALGNTATGSGSVVLQTSPTLITPILGVASAASLSTPTLTTASGDLTLDPTGNVVVKGSTADNLAAALNITNSAPSSLLFVRNDGNIGINNISPGRKLDIVETTGATPQLRLTSDSSNYAEMYVDSVGGLFLDTTGTSATSISILDQNLRVCDNGSFGAVSCPAFDFSSGTGNLLVENKVVADKFEQICPAGYIWVPGSAKYGTLPGFCVMKYEAKNVGGVATSQASDTPWVSISQENARAQCQALGAGYHLISEAEWMTIAENIAATAINDLDADSGLQLATGHSDNGPSSALAAAAAADPATSGCALTSTMENAANAYTSTCQVRGDGSYGGDDTDFGFYGTGQAWSNSGYASGGANKSQLRTHILSNGNVIWDIAGNVWEWTDAIISQVDQPGIGNDGGAGSGNWGEWNVAYHLVGAAANSRPPDDGWTSTNGIGRLWTYGRDETAATTYRAFPRGGHWSYGANAGAFALNLYNSPSDVYSNFGFRCAR